MIPLRLCCRVGRLGPYVGAFREERGLPPPPRRGRPATAWVDASRPGLARWRRARGLTQVEIADLAGCSQGRIADFEGGRAGLSLRTAELLACSAGLSLEQFLQEVGCG